MSLKELDRSPKKINISSSSRLMDEDLVEYYRRRGRLGYVNITIDSIRWKRQLYSTVSSFPEEDELISQLKIFPAKSSKSPAARNKRCKTIQREDLTMKNGIPLRIGAEKAQVSFEWKAWMNCQFQLLFLFAPSPSSSSSFSAATANANAGNAPSSTSSVISHERKHGNQHLRFLLSDPIAVTRSTQPSQFPLYSKSYDLLDAILVLSMEFYPNDLSFSYICIASEANDYTYFLKTLEELKSIAARKTSSSSSSSSMSPARANHPITRSTQLNPEYIPSKVDKELFLLSVQYLKERVENPENLFSALFSSSTEAIEGKKLFPATASTPLRTLNRPLSAASSNTSSPSRLYSQQQQYQQRQQNDKISKAVTSLMDRKYESHVVAHAAKKFLSELQKNLSYSPHIDMFLIEQMLHIYEFILTSVLNHSAPSSSLSTPAPAAASNASHLFLRHQTIHFLLASGIWLLQQTLLASDLCARFQLMKEEISALRGKFYCYDTHLSNEISTADFYLLLEDLGAEYDAEELKLIVAELDCDDMGIIEFPRFILWWCADDDVEDDD